MVSLDLFTSGSGTVSVKHCEKAGNIGRQMVAAMIGGADFTALSQKEKLN